MKYTVFETDLGWIGVMGSEKGLRRMTIPHSSPEEAMRELEEDLGNSELDPEFFADLSERVLRLINGEEVSFPEGLDLPRATPFRKAVWEVTKSIPRGETRSYGWIAGQVGRPAGARAVGQVMATNPVAILIPCHRVVAGDGGLGGYGGHIDMKKRLLEVEGALSSCGSKLRG